MKPENKTALIVGSDQGRQSNQFHAASVSHSVAARKASSKKWQRVLSALLDGPRTSRELERAPVFDHCAHSTASELKKKGIEVLSEPVVIPGYAGEPARVARYSIAPASVQRARALLGAP